MESIVLPNAKAAPAYGIGMMPAQLGQAFNRMRRSLQKAISLLG